MEALRTFKSVTFRASAGWVTEWMKRMGLSVRLRTTGKEVNTAEMIKIAQTYQLEKQHIFNSSHDTNIRIYNADETAVYLDAPGNTTIDEVGSHTVEIGTTKHEKDRVSVLLCVSSDGLLLSALVIHSSKSQSKRDTVSKIQVKYADNNNQQKTTTMFISYNPTAYMNQYVMKNWIQQVISSLLILLLISNLSIIVSMPHSRESMRRNGTSGTVKRVLYYLNGEKVLQEARDAVARRMEEEKE